MMQWLANNSVAIIWFFAVVHLLVFAALWMKHRRHKARLRRFLDNILRHTRGAGDDDDRTVDEAIEGFLHDIRNLLDNHPEQIPELRQRVEEKDELKKYVVKDWFETLYNAARTFIQAYPLMGILGTVLAIGVGMNAPRIEPPAPAAPAAVVAAPAPAAPAHNGSASNIVSNFRNAIWSTVWGLIFGVLFMVGNSLVERRFERLEQYNQEVRDVVRETRRSLTRAGASGGGVA
jgi:biopolymer transport protein ExbB